MELGEVYFLKGIYCVTNSFNFLLKSILHYIHLLGIGSNALTESGPQNWESVCQNAEGTCLQLVFDRPIMSQWPMVAQVD